MTKAEAATLNMLTAQVDGVLDAPSNNPQKTTIDLLDALLADVKTVAQGHQPQAVKALVEGGK